MENLPNQFHVSFHNFDFAPGKDFVQKKSHRRRREAVRQFTLQP
jgi:hypothetical protein